MDAGTRKTVKNLDELALAATELVRTLTPKAGGATLVTLSGELGAGKTAFVKAAAYALGAQGEVTSPTFTIQKEYPLPPDSPFKKLVHIDAYRLVSGLELTPLRFAESVLDASNLIMLEWPEQVEGVLPVPDVALTLEPCPDGSRIITHG